MRRTILVLLSIAGTSLSLLGVVKNGEMAPDFTAEAADGVRVTLSDYRGSYVVLEWLNHSCPFVKKHYKTGNMQRLQEKLTAEGAVWLSIESNAEGKPGYLDPAASLKRSEQVQSKATHVVLDSEGAIGHAYDARCTPQMFLINPDGILVYQGAIDSISSVRIEDISKAVNYVSLAWDALQAGQPFEHDNTAPYGCSIKYQ